MENAAKVRDFGLEACQKAFSEAQQLGLLPAYPSVSQENIETGLFIYSGNGEMVQASMQQVIDATSRLLETQFKHAPMDMKSPKDVQAFFKSKLWGLEHEVFAIAYLDTKLCLINFDIPFRGTINQTSVYPREILKESMRHNAAAVILGHNHPSGVVEPSPADLRLTKKIKDLLDCVDVRVLDHIVVGGSDAHSMAEAGQL